MIFIIFLPTFFIFLFILFKLVKDDHVFLRKNIKMEQIFDIVLIATTFGLIFTQFITRNNYSLPFGVIAVTLGILLVGKYKKLPLGRLLDFFILSFLTSLPLGFLLLAIFSKKNEIILNLFYTCVYLILALVFTKSLKPRLINRTLKEGIISIYFLLLFSVFSLSIAMFKTMKFDAIFFNPENISLIVLLVSAMVLLVKQKLTKTQRKYDY